MRVTHLRGWGIALSFLLGCGAAAESGKDECSPPAMKCEGTVQYHCSLDIALLRRGRHVYVWQELVACDDDDPELQCVERRLPGGRIEADCDYLDNETHN